MLSRISNRPPSRNFSTLVSTTHGRVSVVEAVVCCGCLDTDRSFVAVSGPGQTCPEEREKVLMVDTDTRELYWAPGLVSVFLKGTWP